MPAPVPLPTPGITGAPLGAACCWVWPFGAPLAAGSRVEYHMTGPGGDQPHGYWDVVEADPPRRLVFIDGFAHADGTPNADFPRSEGRVTIESIGAGRTRMSIESRFPSTDAMQQMLAMGMEQGLTQAVGQIDAILAEVAVQTV